MKFIVQPLNNPNPRGKCDLNQTQCVLCSEDPRWCW